MKNDLIELYTMDAFLSLEKKVWDCLLSGDPDADSQLLADDFLGVYASGFSGKACHVNALKNGPLIVNYEISEARIKVLSTDIVLLSYVAKYKHNNTSIVTSMYITSIWKNFSGVWKNIFSQDTMGSEICSY